MEFYSGMFSPGSSEKPDSDKASDRYFELNNFGYSRNPQRDIITNRPAGRCDYQLIYVKKGKLVAMTRGEEWSACTGSVCLFCPKEPQLYRYTAGKDADYIWFHFSGYGCEELVGGLFHESRVLKPGNPYEVEGALQDLCIHCHGEDAFSKEYACGRMIMLFATLKQGIFRGDLAMEKVLLQIRREKFGEGSNADYARLAAMSEAHFMRRFGAYTGMSPHRYKIKYLMGQGAQLLRDTEMNVGEVAFTLGINDSLYFSRLFKKEYGLSPGFYKKKHTS